MVDRRRYESALSELTGNDEQVKAVGETDHCVVLAGPGSGKTKTLTIAMARTLLEDVEPPRGIACITYNNECALELQSRLNALGIEPSAHVFIGTVHSFAMTHVILPYARCTLPGFPKEIAVASQEQCDAAITRAYERVVGDGGNPKQRWNYAETKRRRDVLRNGKNWRERNPELADFVEAYEEILRSHGLIDFDDMPLLALRIVSENAWVQKALRAKFPVLFVDEYQDLGAALHMLVGYLCIKAGIRLFAVGDADQSMYGFLGANPGLLNSLANRDDVHDVTLRFNYRCGSKIIDASMAALGEERGYRGPDDAAEGVINFHGVPGNLEVQAAYVFDQLLPVLQRTVPLDEIAVLYRWAKHGAPVANEARRRGIPIAQSDNTALVQRNSRVSRFIEACARWAAGGWVDANPRFLRLVGDASVLVYGGAVADEEYLRLQRELIQFLKSTIGSHMSAHEWLTLFRRQVLSDWRARATTVTERWDDLDTMIARTDPTKHGSENLSLAHLGGRVEGEGRLNLSTLHSAKGREFEAVILFGMDSDILPNRFEREDDRQMREARRIFYVGVTRAKSSVELIYNKDAPSPLVNELHDRMQAHKN